MSFSGTRAAQILAQELPEGWRVVLIDRNSHFNHLYVLPRFAILPQHAQKAFIPYTNVFRAPSAPDGEEVPKLERHVLVHAQVTCLSEHSVTLSRSLPELGLEGDTPVLNFDYAVYALGSHLPAPINLWSAFEGMDSTLLECGTKKGGIEWLRRFRAVIQEAASVLVVGGGALGVREYDGTPQLLNTHSSFIQNMRQTLQKYTPTNQSRFCTLETDFCLALTRRCMKRVSNLRFSRYSPSNRPHFPS